jgi:hypothetical protein
MSCWMLVRTMRLSSMIFRHQVGQQASSVACTMPPCLGPAPHSRESTTLKQNEAGIQEWARATKTLVALCCGYNSSSLGREMPEQSAINHENPRGSTEPPWRKQFCSWKEALDSNWRRRPGVKCAEAARSNKLGGAAMTVDCCLTRSTPFKASAKRTAQSTSEEGISFTVIGLDAYYVVVYCAGETARKHQPQAYSRYSMNTMPRATLSSLKIGVQGQVVSFSS